jgi:hypothetical protein
MDSTEVNPPIMPFLVFYFIINLILLEIEQPKYTKSIQERPPTRGMPFVVKCNNINHQAKR